MLADCAAVLAERLGPDWTVMPGLTSQLLLGPPSLRMEARVGIEPTDEAFAETLPYHLATPPLQRNNLISIPERSKFNRQNPTCAAVAKVHPV